MVNNALISFNTIDMCESKRLNLKIHMYSEVSNNQDTWP